MLHQCFLLIFQCSIYLIVICKDSFCMIMLENSITYYHNNIYVFVLYRVRQTTGAKKSDASVKALISQYIFDPLHLTLILRALFVTTQNISSQSRVTRIVVKSVEEGREPLWEVSCLTKSSQFDRQEICERFTVRRTSSLEPVTAGHRESE